MHRIVLAPNIGDPHELVALAVEAEAAGWDGFFLWDHVNPAYVGEGLEVHDPWLLLTAVAMSTSRLRLGTGVTPISRRRPWKLAKEIVTLDHLSDGRVTVGIGLGGPDEDEFEAFGDHRTARERASVTDEGLELLDRFLRGERVDHSGRHHEVHAHLYPPARQSPRPPLWIAATPPYRRGVERAARWDGLLCDVKIDAGYAPLRPSELERYAGDLLQRSDFEVATTPHPGHEPDEYESIGVTTLAYGWWPTGSESISDYRRHLFS